MSHEPEASGTTRLLADCGQSPIRRSATEIQGFLINPSCDLCNGGSGTAVSTRIHADLTAARTTQGSLRSGFFRFYPRKSASAAPRLRAPSRTTQGSLRPCSISSQVAT